jgi:hypothetical protein
VKWLHRIGAALVWIALLALVTYALAFMYGCGGAKVPEIPDPVQQIAHVADVGTDVFLGFEVVQTDCTGLDDAACAEKVRARSPKVWAAWDIFAAAYNAYDSARANGGAPDLRSVVVAYCALVATLPADAPRELVVPGVCGGQ